MCIRDSDEDTAPSSVEEGMLVNVAKGVESGVKKFNKFDDKVTKATMKKVVKPAVKNVKKVAKKTGMAVLRGTAGAVGGAIKGAGQGAMKGIKKGLREEEEVKDKKETPDGMTDVTFDAGAALPVTIKGSDDPREIPTAINLKKMKLRSMGLNMSHEPEGDMVEAKVDKGMIFGKSLARNERKFGKKGSTQPQGYFGQKPSQAAELSKKRTDEHKAKRGVKTKGMSEETLDEKCWKGYEKKGMKTMFGKRYPNCVKKKVGESMVNWRDEIGYEGKDEVKKLSEDDMKGMSVKSGHKRPTKSGAGMTQKGVEAYRRRNPGSKLKTAVTTKPSKLKKGSKAANRRKSYCARSAGQMKKFPKAAKDPNSRLRQARRRWNC